MSGCQQIYLVKCKKIRPLRSISLEIHKFKSSSDINEIRRKSLTLIKEIVCESFVRQYI